MKNKNLLIFCIVIINACSFLSANQNSLNIERQVNPKAYIQELSNNKVQQALNFATKNKIANFLGNEAKTLSEISSDLDLEQDLLKNHLETLINYGVFIKTEQDTYQNNSFSECLTLNNPEKNFHKTFSEREYLALLYYPWISQSVHAVVELKIPDLLKNGPLSYVDLAQKTQTDEKLLYRVLKMLADVDLFYESSPGVFELNQISQFLKTDHPNSFTVDEMYFDETFLAMWTSLLDCLKTGKPAFMLKTDVQKAYDYLEKDPEFLKKVNVYMQTKTGQIVESFLDQIDLSQVSSVADLGGGIGHLSKAIVQKYPHIQATVFDLPEIIADAKARDQNQTKNLSFVAGDIFNTIPKGKDVYILSVVLHIFEDDQVLKILENCKKVMPKGSKLLIVERFFSTQEKKPLTSMESVKMSIVSGGLERTDKQYEDLLNQAGFKVSSQYSLENDKGVIEAVVAS